MASTSAGSSDLHELILNATAQGIIALDANGCILLANDAAVNLLGVARNELIGCTQHEALGLASLDGVRFSESACPICRALQDAEHHQSGDYLFINAAGVAFPVELELKPIASTDSPVRAVMSFSDVTRRRAMQQQIVQVQKLQSIGELASGIAHEINTPIQYINDNLFFLQSSFADLRELIQQNQEMLRTLGSQEIKALYDQAFQSLDVDYLVAEIPEAITQTIEGIGRVATIVRAMKEFAHPAEASVAPVDLNRVIRSSITVARNEWKYAAVVDEQLDEALPMVPCLGSEMHQVVLNLITNAAHAVAEKVGQSCQKGTITVSTCEDDGHAVIRITDTGNGIPEEIRSRIFDPFFTTKSVGKGTGQGLAIAHAVTKKHGGSIHFETTLGHGTTFIIRLPIMARGEAGRVDKEQEHEACPVC